MENKKIAALTLGCRVNQEETESMLALFVALDFHRVAFEDIADVYLINTCTVTHLSDRKSRQMIRQAARRNPQGVVVVTGCYAQRNAGEILAIPGVDIVIGTQDRAALPDLVKQALQNKNKLEKQPVNLVKDIMQTREFEEITSLPPHPGRVRAYVKIEDGCNQFCSYCIIPYTRGPVRSRDHESILTEARALTEAGYPEIVLTGIHTAAYGTDKPGSMDLAGLIEQLVEIPKLERLRIGSIDPHEFGNHLLEVISRQKKVCPHFHVALQSGCDRTLAAMNRPYDTAFYRDLLQKIRRLLPEVAITTDVMVGFPGETEADFQASFAFISEMALAGMHIFKYSPRSGTPAADYAQQIAPEVKEARSKKLFTLSKRLWQNFAETYIGKVVQVLVEQKNDDKLWEGHSRAFQRVLFPSDKDLRSMFVNVHIDYVKDGFMYGKIQV